MRMTDTTRRPCPPEPVSGHGRPLRGTIRIEVLVPDSPSIKPVEHVIEVPETPDEGNRLYARRLALGVACDVEAMLMSTPPFGGKEKT